MQAPKRAYRSRESRFRRLSLAELEVAFEKTVTLSKQSESWGGVEAFSKEASLIATEIQVRKEMLAKLHAKEPGLLKDLSMGR